MAANSAKSTIKEKIFHMGNIHSDKTDCEAVVVGAGPYGLAAAAHLKANGIDVRIFGRPMDFWATKMPAGMLLRSPRAASNIADARGRFTLPDFEAANGIAAKNPIAIQTFVDYGFWFQQRLLPELDTREVVRVDAEENYFLCELSDGSRVRSRRVVIAAGIACFSKIPDVFKALPDSLLTHCYSGINVQEYRGKKVIVIGAGQSALESAALLHESGADIEVIAKIRALRWIGMHPGLHKLGLISTMLYSKHDVGPAGISRLVAAPNLVRIIPLSLRDKIRTRAVRAAGSNWLPTRLKNVNVKAGRYAVEANIVGSRVQLKLDDGSVSMADHVLLGTGYTVDISRFPFISPQLLSRVSRLDGYPDLRTGFESSVDGLYFLGATAARTYGPLLYFVTGTEFAARELTRHVIRSKEAA